MSSSPAAQLQSSGSDSEGSGQACEQSIVIPNRFITIADSFEKKEHSWFVTSQIPTDLSIQVQDVTFTVHKYPLMSKCGYIARLELQPSISNLGYDLKLENFPGGSETFEIILKFCYGLPIAFNPNNIAPLRCASEFLDMSEEYEDGNLISKTEAFLTLVILSSWKETITVLKSCKNLSPWAENLQIVRRCCDSIAWKASRENSTTEDIANRQGWWFDDVATLGIDHFMRIITTIKVKGTKPEIIGKCIMHYAKKWLPGMDVELEGLRGYGYGKHELQFSILNAGKEEVSVGQKEQRTIIENLVNLLPHQDEGVSCKFFLQMLKMAMVYNASPALISELEKRVGMMLEDANANDLLIPNYKNEDHAKLNSPEHNTMHNIDVVQRIMDYFLMHEQQQQQKQQNIVKTNERKSKFFKTSTAYCLFQSHPSLSEHDRRRLCKLMNCEKLSLDACTHAAQNDRLPLRTVVQVLFSEQVKMRTAMQEKEPALQCDNSEQDDTQPSTSIEIKNLREELENVKTRMAALQKDYSELQREYEKLSNKHKIVSSWSLGWRKIKNSFHSKADADETGNRRQTFNSTGRQTSFRRRPSLP
ncbi:BTB/POZ domain-containing protein DOT3 isoform X3 [Citrus sinensis]|uniref:BTB/POZ domain-containing protein DOT3 isoform X3 n=1 Tax=Citrus sinensis TaxID=2711 RepID=UPI000D630F1A|nr:BTB/POZ domain-containing protein DOT3 isoform X3 [Citrus sinensis]